MKIIYLYNKKPCAAIKAAYNHLQLSVIEEQNYVNTHIEEGNFYYLGMDKELNEVYLLYSSKGGYIITNLLKGFAHICGEEIMVIKMENK